VTITGLSRGEAAQRLAVDGRNEVLAAPALGWPRALVGQLREVVIVVLIVAGVLTAAVGDLADMGVIAVVVVINCLLGAGQEVRAGRALTALASLTAPRATVVRDGLPIDIDARDVVRGDLLRVVAGDVVAADGLLTDSHALRADESLLTGESAAVDKASGDDVFAGTVITRGRGDVEVAGTAEATAVGRIARSVRDSRIPPTPVQRQLAVLGRRLALVVAVAALAVGTLNLLSGRSVETSLVLAVSLAVAAIPESLPAVVSLSLAMGAHRMATAGAVVRRLAAVEALGSVTVIATDKTGTLTSGSMSIAQVWTPDGNADEVHALLEACVLCNDACAGPDLQPGERDDPLEVALVTAALEDGVDVSAVRRERPRIAETPFDAAARTMTTVHRTPGGGLLTIVKGAPDALLRVAGSIDAAEVSRAEAALGALTDRGHRVVAVTMRTEEISGISHDLRLLGVVAFADPPRPESAAFVAAFRAAGVQPVMITGDHQATAHAIARGVGIAIDNVHARVRPEEKTAIVRSLQAQGEIVAMTGDGVNDAPALRVADVGIAMGRRGTEVAKQAADIVLTGDDLSVMVGAIGEGRRAYDNLRRFLHYGLSGGAAEVLIMLVGPAVGFPLPLQSGQILWVNLLTHGLPGVAMGNEPAARDVLSRPPRRPDEQLLDAHTGRRVGLLGSVIALVCLLAGAWAKHDGHPWQSTIFVSLAFAQLAVALALRPAHARGARNRMLDAAVVLNVVLAVLAVQWQPLRDLLRTDALSLVDMGRCAVAAAVAAAVARLQVRVPGISRDPRRHLDAQRSARSDRHTDKQALRRAVQQEHRLSESRDRDRHRDEPSHTHD
jgi:Ca2+-transporting ATPase